MNYLSLVISIAFSPDSRRLVSSSGLDETIYLWDVENAQTLFTLCGHTGGVEVVAFSPDGAVVAGGGQDGTIQIWDVARRKTIHILRGHQKKVRCVAFCLDGTILASSGEDRTVRLWNLATGQLLNVLRKHNHQIWGMAISGDGNTLASGGSDGLVYLWDLHEPQNAQATRVLQGHADPIYRLAVHPRGDLFATGEDAGRVRLWQVERESGEIRPQHPLWDLRTNDYPRIAYSAMVDCINLRPVAFSPDGKYLVSGGIDRMVRIWDLEKDVELHSLVGHTADVTSTIFLPDGDRIISSGYDGTLRLWDVQTGACLQIARTSRPYEGMNITGVTGISEAQREALKALGAVEA